MIKRLAVRTPHERQPISAMSGGNAQKVVLARQLVERPEVLVLAEPTQGVDVGAKEEIHRIITELAENGTAVLVVTSDLPEALRISDRLQVVRGGTTTVEFGPDATQVDVLAAAAGAEHTDTEEQKAVTERSAPTVDVASTDGRGPTESRRGDDRHAHRAAGVTRRAAEGAQPDPPVPGHRPGAGADRRHRRHLGRPRAGHPGLPDRGLHPPAAGGHRADRPHRGRHDDHHHHRRDRRLRRRRDHGVLGDHREGAGRRGVAGAGGAAVGRRRRRARPGQRRADRLRPGARDHHHVRHREHLPVPRPADLRLEHGQRDPADLRVLRPRRGGPDPGRPERVPDHRRSSPRSPGGTCGTPPVAGTSTPSAATRTPRAWPG